MSALASGLATFGAVDTYIRVACAIVIGIIFIIIGATIKKNPDKHTSQTTGTASNVNCTTSTGKNKVTSCVASVDYTVNNQKYTFSGNYGQIANGQTVSVYYDPSNPGDAVGQPVPQALGTFFIVIGIILIIAGIGFGYFFSKLGQQGQAVVGGVEAAGEVASFLNPQNS